MKLGTLLDGKYQIVRPIAKGGMANIYEGREGKQRVVVKVLKEGLSKDPEIVARFHRESRAASSLKSKHVVRILGFGTTGHDEPYLVMEYLFGNDLSKELEKRKVVPLEEAATYMAQICHAMIEAHDAGVVHRDLKPTNLYLAREAGKHVVKVLDFGIAKVTGNASEEQITRPTSLMGSPLYMSPETFKGAKNADARSDIWSLGVIFYQMVTGATPFTGDNAAGVAMAVMRSEQASPSARRPELPHSVDVVIGRALKKEPNERYQTVREFLAALEVYLPRGRNDTMTIQQVVAPPDHDDDPRTLLRTKDNAITDLGMMDPTRTSAADGDELNTIIAPTVKAPPVDDEPADPPTKIRAPAAPAAPVLRPPVAARTLASPRAQLGAAALAAAESEPQTIVQPIPEALIPVELPGDDLVEEESSTVDAPAPRSVTAPPPPSHAAPTPTPFVAPSAFAPTPAAEADAAPRQESSPRQDSSPSGRSYGDRASPAGGVAAGDDDAFPVPKKKIPPLAWIVPGVALAAGFIGWLVGSSGTPPATTGSAAATASAAPATSHRAPPPVTAAEATATVAPTATEVADTASATADPSATDAATESVATLDADTPPSATAPATAVAVGKWRPPPRPTSKATATASGKKKFTPKKI